MRLLIGTPDARKQVHQARQVKYDQPAAMGNQMSAACAILPMGPASVECRR